MARTKDKVLTLAVVSAIGVGWLAVHYRATPAIVAVLGGAGLYAIVSGIRMIVTRLARIPTGPHPSATELHTGLTARIWGVLFVMFGGMMLSMAYTVLRFPPGSPDIARLVLGTPTRSGLALAVTGAMVGMYGATRLVAGRSAFAETKLPRFEIYFMGTLFALIGAAITTAGALMLVAPEMLTALANWSLGVIESWARPLAG